MYTILKNKDSFGGDIKHTKENFDELKKTCNKMIDCEGFNNLGYIKKSIKHKDYLVDIEKCNLYIKSDFKQNIIDVRKKIIKDKYDLTFVITSCKRLNLFVDTMDHFIYNCQDFGLIKKWICVDDNSSKQDRKVMMEKYPFFQFIFKKEDEKGHAQSLNIILDVVKTKYVILFEDDWRCVEQFSLFHYIQYLEKYEQDQIVFQLPYNNTESSLYRNTKRDLISKGEVFNDYDDYVVKAIVDDKNIVQYNFNIEHPLLKTILKDMQDYFQELKEQYHIRQNPKNKGGFFYPGFSLKPSIFSMDKFKKSGIKFEENNKYLELKFGFELEKIGFKVSCTHIGILHTGNDVSAYVLNDESRSFDKK